MEVQLYETIAMKEGEEYKKVFLDIPDEGVFSYMLSKGGFSSDYKFERCPISIEDILPLSEISSRSVFIPMDEIMSMISKDKMVFQAKKYFEMSGRRLVDIVKRSK